MQHLPSSGRHRKRKGALDQLLAPGFHDSLLTSVPLLPDTWGKITSYRTHRVSMREIRRMAARHRLTVEAIKKMLEKLP